MTTHYDHDQVWMSRHTHHGKVSHPIADCFVLSTNGKQIHTPLFFPHHQQQQHVHAIISLGFRLDSMCTE
ncbi:hypothetical protein VTJ04DRAFT_9289 [Mycothermus thermophilus]|uniref:uncharacterized protein n=1 Tax=Humicola insolens TaxID=85995 RepID=UPI003743A163